MPKYDERTARGWPLPHKKNKLADDADRIRQTINAIDAFASEFEANLHNVDEVNDALCSRMDVIAGQTTEDTEILDARVDAEGNAHPNLGHNIRSLYAAMLTLNKLRLEQDIHLQSQVNENAGTLLHLILELSRLSDRTDDTANTLRQSIQDAIKYIDSVKSELSDKTDDSVDSLRQYILQYISGVKTELSDKTDETVDVLRLSRFYRSLFACPLG